MGEFKLIKSNTNNNDLSTFIRESMNSFRVCEDNFESNFELLNRVSNNLYLFLNKKENQIILYNSRTKSEQKIRFQVNKSLSFPPKSYCLPLTDFDISENNLIVTIRDFDNLPSRIYLIEIVDEFNNQKIV